MVKINMAIIAVAENHIGYDNGKGNGNRKAKFCTVLDSGCLQCTGIERTDDYIAQLKANPSKKKSNKAHKDLIPMSFLICQRAETFYWCHKLSYQETGICLAGNLCKADYVQLLRTYHVARCH